ncbi:glutamate 5-kinase [Candidatus Hydrogenedentota bacterium]
MKRKCHSFSRLVVKIGSSLIIDSDGSYAQDRIAAIAAEIGELVKSGCEVLLVSSGAIGSGMTLLDQKKRPVTLPERQATAAIGQSRLMHFYEELFRPHGILVAQLLLTREGLDDRQRYLNVRNTILTLLQMGNVVPIMNENDSVAVDEIRVGDNDNLSAAISAKVSADMLVLLTDVEGLCTRHPESGALSDEVISEIKTIDENVWSLAGGTDGKTTVGGMATKIEAAVTASRAGCAVVIANGSRPNVLTDIYKGEPVGTLFHPAESAISSRKRWIAGLAAKGIITVDDGAVKALRVKGRSLLPSGILSVEGGFEVGDGVSIAASDGAEFARGLANYSAEDIDRIKGNHSERIEDILGAMPYPEIVHRDNMTVL